ncbi:MAG: class I SAM-dependent methyltransferase, partial [Hyphomicrobiales bacterium]
MLFDHPVELAVPAPGEAEHRLYALQRGPPGAHAPHPQHLRAQAAQPVDVLVRLQPQVVAEPLRLFVRVGVAAHVHEQRRVVHDRPLFAIEPQPLGQAQPDEALAQHVLHRLPEAEVDAERQRAQKFGEPHPRPVPSAFTREVYCRRSPPAAVLQDGRELRRAFPPEVLSCRAALCGAMEVGVGDYGWAKSAKAWIAHQDQGETNRELLLDPIMLRLAGDVRDARVLDVGCGEGRFGRMLAARGATVVGLDPTRTLVSEAS